MNVTSDQAVLDLATGLDRRSARARHDLWALEMDRALFSARPNPEQGAVPEAEPPVLRPSTAALTREVAGADLQAMKRTGDRHAVQAGEFRGDGATMASTADAAPAPLGVATESRASAPGGTATSTGVADVAANWGLARAAGNGAAPLVETADAPATAATPPGTAQASPAQAAASVAGEAGAFASPGSAGTTSPAINGANAGAGQDAGAELSGAAVLARTSTAAPAVTATLSQPESLPATAAPLQVALPQEGVMSEAAEPAFGLVEFDDEAGAPPAAQPGGEEYPERVLHLYQEQDGVKAWIRDAGLGPDNTNAVAQALALQLATQGSRLNGLTVNGRPVPLSPRAAALQDSGESGARAFEVDSESFPKEG